MEFFKLEAQSILSRGGNKEALRRIATELLIEQDEKWLADGKAYLKGCWQGFGEFTEKTLRSTKKISLTIIKNVGKLFGEELGFSAFMIYWGCAHKEIKKQIPKTRRSNYGYNFHRFGKIQPL